MPELLAKSAHPRKSALPILTMSVKPWAAASQTNVSQKTRIFPVSAIRRLFGVLLAVLSYVVGRGQ
jgi:hypothetical protein